MLILHVPRSIDPFYIVTYLINGPRLLGDIVVNNRFKAIFINML